MATFALLSARCEAFVSWAAADAAVHQCREQRQQKLSCDDVDAIMARRNLADDRTAHMVIAVVGNALPQATTHFPEMRERRRHAYF